MPPKAKNSTPKVSKATADRWKGKAEDYRKKYLAFRKETRENKPVDAAINTGIMTLTGVTTGALRGLTPDEFAWGEGANRRTMDLRLWKDIGGVVIGAATAGIGVATEMPELIYAGGGPFIVSAASLAEMGTRKAREGAMDWWEGKDTGNGTAPPLEVVNG